jgi:predicted metal-binding protein
MSRAIVICSTCKHADGRKCDEAGRSAGSLLQEQVEAALTRAGRNDIRIETQACLWNCDKPCSVVFRDTARFSYITGKNAPTAEQAEALIAWFDKHGESATGEVPFREWPQAMRGHFIARIPPARTEAGT